MTFSCPSLSSRPGRGWLTPPPAHSRIEITLAEIKFPGRSAKGLHGRLFVYHSRYRKDREGPESPVCVHVGPGRFSGKQENAWSHSLPPLFQSIFLFPHPARFDSGPSPLSHSPFVPGGSSAAGLSESGQGTCVCWRGDPGKRHYLCTLGAKARFCPIQKQEHESGIPDQVTETALAPALELSNLGYV